MPFRAVTRKQTPDASVEDDPDKAAGESNAVKQGEAYVIAQAIDKAGMNGVASLALEIGKPLSWIGGQFAWMLEPFLGTFAPFSRKGSIPIEGIARLLESPDGAADLASHLEELSNKKSAGGTR